MTTGSDKEHIYCYCCGTRVRKKHIVFWWPIRLHIRRLKRSRFFSRWGIHIGYGSHGRFAMQRVIAIGPLIITLGPNNKEYIGYEYIREHRIWIDPEMARKRRQRMEPYEQFINHLLEERE